MGVPERIEFLSAVLLTSRQPDRLAVFYRDVLGLPLHAEQHGPGPSHWGCELGDVHFAIHPADAGGADSPRGPVRLAFWVFDLRSFVAHLDQDHGITCLSPIHDLGDSSLITVVADPDGNEVELTQMGRSWVDHLAQHRQGGADVISRAISGRSRPPLLASACSPRPHPSRPMRSWLPAASGAPMKRVGQARATLDS